MHALLLNEHGLLSAYAAPPKASRLRQAAIVAFAAAASLASALLFWQRSPQAIIPERGAEVATISRSIGARFAYGLDGRQLAQQGLQMRVGVYHLLSGVVQLAYENGASLIIEGPAEFRLNDANSLHLVDGKLSAHIPKTAIGFRVDAVSASVIDLGTDFAVAAAKGKATEVHVFEGEVRVELDHPDGPPHTPLSLTKGRAARVDSDTGIPSGIELQELEFLRRLEASESAYSVAVRQLDPAVYYRMEPGPDGRTLYDSSDARADAVVVPGKTTDPVWAAGKVGVAFETGGPSEQTYAYASAYPQSPDGRITVVAWVYANARTRWASIAKNWAELTPDWDFHAGQFHFGLFDDEGCLEGHLMTGPLQETFVLDSEPIPLHRWIHVALVADGSHLRLYRDGREISSSAYEQSLYDPALTTLAIATKLNAQGTAQANPGWATWDGRLDEMAIFNYPLTSDQIEMLYRAAE
ncbi:MAG: FecR domain-containing protein [Planctomycetales bacterium]|nr:FecR domain-containing protein [Planctomycetales bacterium]